MEGRNREGKREKDEVGYSEEKRLTVGKRESGRLTKKREVVENMRREEKRREEKRRENRGVGKIREKRRGRDLSGVRGEYIAVKQY